MRQDFIPYEEALALKELGFDEPCIGVYTNRYMYTEGRVVAINQREGSAITGDRNSQFLDPRFWYVTAPTFSQAFRWFRLKHDSYYEIKRERGTNDSGNVLFVPITQYKWKKKVIHIPESTYEEAELACLKKLIELVK